MGKDALAERTDHAAVPPWSDSHESWNVGIHWFRGSFPREYHDQLLSHLLGLFGECDSRHAGFWRYDEQQVWGNGIRLFYHSSVERSEMTAGRNAIEIPGETIQTMKPGVWLDLMMTLVRYYMVRPSRLDVFFDDHARTIHPLALVDQVYELSVVEGRPQVTKADWAGLEKISPRFESNLFELVSASVTFGRRGSKGGGRCVRIYDKSLESHGENKAIRFEVELSDEQAREAADFIIDRWVSQERGDVALRDVAHYLGTIVAGSMDFRQRSAKPKEKNLARLPRFPWWTAILHRLGGELVFHGQRLGKTIVAMKEYVDRQVTATLQSLREAFGKAHFGAWLTGLLDSESRLRVEHRWAIEEFRAAVPEAAWETLPTTAPPGQLTFGQWLAR